MPAGGKHGNIPLSRSRAYEAMRRKGFSKAKAARIAHAGRTYPQRSRMARKAARTRRRGGGRRMGGWGR
jgi:hypothetical protein